jgi:hypothetical protein
VDDPTPTTATTTCDAAAAVVIDRLAGSRHVEFLQRHLRHLRDHYDHGNRKLFYDELVTAYVLAFFNPAMRSLRSIEDVSRASEAAADRGGGGGGGEPPRLRRLCRSTVSDANALMDARLLEPLIRRLRGRVRDLKKQDGQLARLLEQVQIVDGSFFASAANVAWALRSRNGHAKARGTAPRFKARLDLRLAGDSLLPVSLCVCGRGTGEAASASAGIEPGTIYVADRGFESLKYVDELLKANADFVLRAKRTLNFAAREDQTRTLDEADRQAGVIGDRLGRLTGSPHARAARAVPDRQELREVLVFDPAHPDEPIRLITSLLDLPAHVIAELYRWRWQIELFFRWLKVHAHFEHLISRSKNGMTLGFYVAVIAVLLIYLRTGRPMSKYAYNLLACVAAGWARVEDVLPVLERREAACQRERERQARKRAEKTSA